MKKRSQLSPSEIRERKRYTIADLNALWQFFTSHKKWFALSVILCLFWGVAYIYLSRPSYNIQGKMILIDRRQSNTNSLNVSSALLNQLPSSLGSSLNLGRTTNADNEKEILKTKQLSKDAIRD